MKNKIKRLLVKMLLKKKSMYIEMIKVEGKIYEVSITEHKPAKEIIEKYESYMSEHSGSYRIQDKK